MKNHKKHNDRMSDIGRFALPPKGTIEYEIVRKRYQKNQMDAEEYKKIWKEACSVVQAQDNNGAGLPIDSLLRSFLIEYNSRNVNYGLRSMPASFNVLEAFFEYDPRLSIFKLRQEKDHIFSFLDFLDYATSGEAENNLKVILDCLENEVVYSYNILNDPNQITISTMKGKEYAVGGVALIRHGSEISVLLLTGEKADVKVKTEYLRRNVKVGRPIPGKELLKPAEEYSLGAVPLLGNNSFCQALALTRIDLNDMTQSVRYYLDDIGNSFITTTDDMDIYPLDKNGNFIDKAYEKCAKESVNKINAYSTIFEICKTIISLPMYFEKYVDDVENERHQTRLGENKEGIEVKNQLKMVDPQDRVFYRDVSILKRPISNHPDIMTYKAPDIKIDVSGYWKQLSPDKIGSDKKGNPIHGKTWVKKQLSWIESNPDPPPLQAVSNKSNNLGSKNIDNIGYIYVMRSAAHEKDVFKIGYTLRSSDIRADELSRGTGSPDKFLVVDEWIVSDPKAVEAQIHDHLSEYRLNPKREFFKVPYKKVHEVVNSIIPIYEIKS